MEIRKSSPEFFNSKFEEYEELMDEDFLDEDIED